MRTHFPTHFLCTAPRIHPPLAGNNPDKFTGVGLLVGDGMYDPGDPQNPARLERLVKEDGLSGLRLSPIYNKASKLRGSDSDPQPP